MVTFRWIYSDGTTYHDSLLSGSYLHFSGMPCGWDYLNNTIKT